MNSCYQRLLRYTFFLWFCLLILIVSGETWAYNKTYGYKSAIVLEYPTGRILYEEDAYLDAIPASLVKMMVIYLAMEQLEAGTIHLTDEVTVSAWASHMGGTQIYLKEGETLILEDLLKAMVISSANDAAVAVAEFLAESTDAFVTRMNAKAQVLGLKNTTFANVHGLPPSKGQKDNITSAYDMALLAQALLQRFPQVLGWTSTLKDTIRNGAFPLTNTNRRLIKSYPGLDGLKTGFHARAGFNICATAKRGERRLIVVIMDGPTQKIRDRAVRHLFDQGFKQFEQMSKVIGR